MTAGRHQQTRGAAIFDLDGTVIDCSSERRFFLYLFRQGIIGPRDLLRWISVAARRFPSGLMYAMKANRSYLAGHDSSTVDQAARNLFDLELRRRVSDRALACVNEHHAAGDFIVLLSGSLTMLAEPFREVVRADVVRGSDLEVKEDAVTGALSSLHPVGVGKVAHAKILAQAYGFDLSHTAAYADSASDIPLLEQVGLPFPVNPDRGLRRHARARGWCVLDWHGRQPLDEAAR